MAVGLIQVFLVFVDLDLCHDNLVFSNLFGDLLLDLQLEFCVIALVLVRDLLHVEFAPCGVCSEFLVHLHRVDLSLFLLLLAEIGLKILEQIVGTDLHVSDLYGLQTDTPAFDNLLHVIHDNVAQIVTILEHVNDL